MSAEDVDIAIAKSIAEDSAEEIVVGCLPATEEPSVPSVSASCSQCGILIWASQRVLGALPPRGKLICLYCVAGNPRVN
jgi:hypothetical protein